MSGRAVLGGGVGCARTLAVAVALSTDGADTDAEVAMGDVVDEGAGGGSMAVAIPPATNNAPTPHSVYFTHRFMKRACDGARGARQRSRRWRLVDLAVANRALAAKWLAARRR
jgi:hypothetical protein